MSSTRPIEAHGVKKGSNIMLKGHPCKCVEVKTSKTGKHGHAKCNITGVDWLTARKYNEVHPGHIILQTFDILQTEYEVSDVNFEEETVTAMNPETNEEETIDFNETTSETVEKWAEFLEQFKENQEASGDKFFMVTTITAPVGETDAVLKTQIKSWAEGKE